ncbi:probable calcium-binding protein CML41 [Mercurialis annua]|uniref:probable calcium-binding protein CML41 n=1 Tax=Mercurialis annua TaxID=3986 RepID=UPI0021603D72|nr:probable calcium-binding protein CML41 [Mercurialis annua]
MATEKPPKRLSFKNLRLIFKPLRPTKSNHVPTETNCMVPRKDDDDEELQKVFSHFDGNGDKKISALEIRAYFGSMGEYMSHEQAREVIKEFDSDEDNLLDFNDFLKLMKKGDEKEDLKKAFEMFEMKKGDGFITSKGLQKMLNRLGDDKSLDECVAMIRVFDTNGDGVLDFHEFYQMMA